MLREAAKTQSFKAFLSDLASSKISKTSTNPRFIFIALNSCEFRNGEYPKSMFFC